MAPVVVVVVVLALLVCFVVWLASRDGSDTPRRRENRRLRTRYRDAQLTLQAIEDVLGRYDNQLDVVAVSLVAEVREQIRIHDKKMLENDK